MKHVLLRSVAGAGLLFFGGLTLSAQDHWREYRENERFYKGRLFERVRTDLDRAESNTPAISGDRYRLVQAKRELNELQDKFNNGRYDAREMDDVMQAMS